MHTALHIVYHTTEFTQAIVRAVNWGGDSDSIAAVVGQICGAMYGLQPEAINLYKEKML
jgi:ADP-ribosyl-[dinitrogen reductase] hydrolase